MRRFSTITGLENVDGQRRINKLIVAGTVLCDFKSKCVVDSFSEYVLNTYCVPRLGAVYTAEQDRHICSSQGVQSLAW